VGRNTLPFTLRTNINNNKKFCRRQLDTDMNLNKTKYLFIGEMHSNLKMDKESEIQSCQEHKYLGVIFDTS
jgi:hypothetical protein